MSVIYLSHPTHGAKVAIDEAEAQHDEANGWERFTLDEIQPVGHSSDDDGEPLPVKNAARRRRRAEQED